MSEQQQEKPYVHPAIAAARAGARVVFPMPEEEQRPVGGVPVEPTPVKEYAVATPTPPAPEVVGKRALRPTTPESPSLEGANETESAARAGLFHRRK